MEIDAEMAFTTAGRVAYVGKHLQSRPSKGQHELPGNELQSPESGFRSCL